MKAVVLHTPGEAENLILEERPIPTPQKDEVLIKIKAFGLNRSELMTRKGLSPTVMFPRTLGIECVGEVEFDPSGEYKKGQQILAFMGGMGRDFDGSYAEYAVLPKKITHPFKSKLAWEVLAAIPEMYQTVYGSLHLALKIQKGETLLVRGGTSSVGLLAIQIAKHLGLTVLATTRNALKKEMIMEYGATHVLIDDGTLENKIHAIFPEGVDKVLELIGAVTLSDSLKCTKPGGAVCMTGMLSETWSVPNFSPMEFIPSTVNLTVYDSGEIRSSSNVFQEFIQLVEDGSIKLKPGNVFHLDEIVKAHQLMESNEAKGKIVVLT